MVLCSRLTKNRQLQIKTLKLIEYQIDNQGGISRVNSNFEDIVTFNEEEIGGRYYGFLKYSDSLIIIINKIYFGINEGKACFSVVENVSKKGGFPILK